MIRRAPLLALTALAAGLSAVAGAMAAGDPAEGRFGSGVRAQVAERDRAAAARARQLDLREQAARAAEQRMSRGGPAAAPAASAAPAPPEPSEDERLNDLAKIYAAMKPRAAAPIFEQLTLEVQVKIASRMRERAAAQIMAAMTPRAAAALSMAIAKRQTSYTVVGASGPSPRGSPPRVPAASR